MRVRACVCVLRDHLVGSRCMVREDLSDMEIPEQSPE